MRFGILQRLTLWNSSVLALALSIFAAAAWFTLAQALETRSVTAVRESARAVAAAIRAGQQAVLDRGEVERERGATEQAVLRELRAGDLDIFIADEAEQVMAVRQPAQRRMSAVGAPEGTPDDRASESSAAIILPPEVRALMDAAREPAQRARLGDSGVLVQALQLGALPARAALVRLPPASQAMVGEPTLLIVAARPERDDLLLLRQVRTTLLLAIPFVLLLSLLAGFALARRSLAPLEAINARTAQITAADLDARLPVANAHDELGRLATIINDLLARVGQAFATQRQFVADASHELRTPIAIIRGEAEVTLRREHRTEAEYRDAVHVIRDEAVHLTTIVEDLFLLARMDAGHATVTRRPIDVEELVQDAVRGYRTLAEARGVTIEVAMATAVASRPETLMGDDALLRRLLRNLLDNALRHAPSGTAVTLSLSYDHPPQGTSVVRLQIRDHGPGVDPALRPRLFQRFVHGDAHGARGHAAGTGLGLAIADAIAHAHGGTITLLNRTPGATFEVRLPLSPLRDSVA